MKTSNFINKLTLLFLLVFSLLFTKCSDNDPDPEKIIVNPIILQSILALDIGNEISSEDIAVKFSFDKVVDGIKLIILPTSMIDNATDDELLGVSEGRFVDIPASLRTDYLVSLENFLDINGDAIVNGTDYSIALIYVKDEQSFISDKYASITLTDKNPLVGNYVGLWNDNLFADVNVSFKIEDVALNSINTRFYISTNFQPQFGSSNDGFITLNFSEEQKGTFSSFRYDQDLPTYMGGCPGLYEGAGSYDAFSISINFTGDDCDGHHTGGSIKVDRQF